MEIPEKSPSNTEEKNQKMNPNDSDPDNSSINGDETLALDEEDLENDDIYLENDIDDDLSEDMDELDPNDSLANDEEDNEAAEEDGIPVTDEEDLEKDIEDDESENIDREPAKES
jgi:hypothetical protein